MKKLINDPENVVREELAGIARAHPDLVTVSVDPHYVVRAEDSRLSLRQPRSPAKARMRCSGASRRPRG